MNIVVRKCMINDTNDIYKLNCEEMGYEYSIKKTRLKLEQLLNSKKDKVYVASVDNIVVGYVHANDYDVIYAEHMKNIMGIAVSKHFKRMGIGKLLLDTVEEWAKKSGACGVRLVSGETRIGAHEFYHSCGYNRGHKQLNFKKFFWNM